MKYTVILDSSVPEEMRAALTDQLVARFGLAPDQAAKLASRKAGRLLKPTSLARAETLLGVYQGLGLGVKLQEVADEEGAVPLAASAAPVAVAAAPVAAAVPVAPATAPAVDPGWADFAGSLNLPGTPRAEEPAPAPAPRRERSERPEREEGVISPTFTEVPESAAASATRRESLGRRITLTALLPLISTAAVTLGFLAFLLPRTQTTLIREGAQAVAAAVGTNVDVTDQDKVDNQLRALVKQAAVGFVQVVTPDGLNFFRSKDEAQDPVLGARVDAWVQKNPGDSSFTYSDSPAERAREQIKQLKEAGLPDDNPAILQLQQQAKSASSGTVTSNYELVRLGVYQEGEQRVARPIGTGKGQPLYIVGVGVASDASRAQTTRTLLLIFAVSLLALAVAVFFALRTARRVVAPIERLVKAADAISLGQLDTQVKAERNDEIGDLAQALERMRLSLEAAMSRLRRRRTAK